MAGRLGTSDTQVVSSHSRRVLGKKTLDPSDPWEDVTDRVDLDEAGFLFFKATVEMK